MKKAIVSIVVFLTLIQLASADLFVVSVDKWVNCKEHANNITVCEKNHAYKLLENNIIPSVNTNYYDEVIDDVVKVKNNQINRLENEVTGMVTHNSEITDWYSAMEKVYIIGIVLLSLLLVSSYYHIYKLKKR